jgi:hypothetical protein
MIFIRVKRMHRAPYVSSVRALLPAKPSWGGVNTETKTRRPGYCVAKKQGQHKQYVNCLRGLLTSTPHGLTVPKGKNGLGKFGCGNKNRKKHVNYLIHFLDRHGPHYGVQTRGSGQRLKDSTGNPMGDYLEGDKEYMMIERTVETIFSSTKLFFSSVRW